MLIPILIIYNYKTCSDADADADAPLALFWGIHSRKKVGEVRGWKRRQTGSSGVWSDTWEMKTKKSMLVKEAT